MPFRRSVRMRSSTAIARPMDSTRLVLGELEYIGIRQIADRFRAEYIRLTGASKPGTSRR